MKSFRKYGPRSNVGDGAPCPVARRAAEMGAMLAGARG